MARQFEYQQPVYEGQVVDVYKVGVRMPDGKVIERDFLHYGNAAVILPVLPDGSIVMIRNYRFAAGETLYELPAGMCDGEEEPLSCATRELTEETGYTAGRIEPLGHYFTAPGTSDEVIYAYLATDLKDGQQALEIYEQITVDIFPDAKVREMVTSGAIYDAKTIAALALYWLRKP